MAAPPPAPGPPLAAALADRFELLICRRAVLERLHRYNQSRLKPLLGERMAGVLDTVLQARSQSAEQAIQALRNAHPDFTQALERRLLLLFALRQGRAAMEAMVAESVISKEVYTWVEQELGRAWQLGIARPALRKQRGGGDGK